MSIYAGLSLREIYERRCKDYGIKCNSALMKQLPGFPDDFGSLKLLDLSSNFVGPKGILPLLHVIECCTHLVALDLRSQSLNKESVDHLCSTLRSHRSVQCINLSENPVNIASGVLLLELCKENPAIEEVILFNTQIRGAMLNLIETQTKLNAERNRIVIKASPTKSETSIFPQEASGGGAAAAVALKQTTTRSSMACICNKRVPETVIVNALSEYPSTVHPFLFNEDPTAALHALCNTTDRMFYDVQFPADCQAIQKLDNYIYGPKNFKRLSEIYPNATVFPPGNEGYGQPQKIKSGFEWIFTCLQTSIRRLPELRNLLCFAPDDMGSSVGIFGARLFIDGQWRYAFVDDFVPVDHQSLPLFTRAAEGENGAQYIWPCVLEKLIAKVHGGYNGLDTNIWNEDAELHHQLARDPTFTEIQAACSPPRTTTCAKLMADFTGGVNIVRYMHRDGFDSDAWWSSFSALLEADPLPVAVAISRCAAKTLPGIDPTWAYEVREARQINGLRLVQLISYDCSSSWKGNWSDESVKWEEHPDVAAHLQRSSPPRLHPWRESKGKPMYRRTVMQPEAFRTSGKAKKVTTFWMLYLDFILAFEEVHVCRKFDGFHERIAGGQWTCKASGGNLRNARWYSNPHFRFRVDSQAPCYINLSLADSRFRTEDSDAISFQILRCSRYPIVCPESDSSGSTIIYKPKYYHTDSLSFEGVLEPGDDYWIVPNTLSGGKIAAFYLRIASPSAFIVSEESLRDHWHLQTVECDLGDAGELQFGEGSAQVSVSFGEATNRTDSSRFPVIGGKEEGKLIVEASRIALEGEEEGLLELGGQPPAPLAIIVTRCDNDDLTRISGDLSQHSVVTRAPFKQGEFVNVEASVSAGDRFMVACCVLESEQRASVRKPIQFHLWSSIPMNQVAPLPPWECSTVNVEWACSGSNFHTANNPQIEVYPVHAGERLVARMRVTEFSGDGLPVITLFGIMNSGRLGEGVRGLIPSDRIVARSPYVRSEWVQCQITIERDADSLLLMPCLQPVGSRGQCTVEVFSDLGRASVRVLSTFTS